MLPTETFDLAADGPEFERLASSTDVDYANVDRALSYTYDDIQNENAGILGDFDTIEGLLTDANNVDGVIGVLDDSNEFSDLLSQSDLLDYLIGSLF